MSDLTIGPDEDLVVVTLSPGSSLLLGGEVEIQLKRTRRGDLRAILAVRKPKSMNLVRSNVLRRGNA